MGILMKHILSILILLGFMSSAFSESYLCKIDESMGLNFDWDKREYYGTRFVTTEKIIKIVNNDECHEYTMFKSDDYVKLLDREPDEYGNVYKCLKETKLGEKESARGDICLFRTSRNHYECTHLIEWLNAKYQFNADGGRYLGFYAPFNTDHISTEEAALPPPTANNMELGPTRPAIDTMYVEAGKCARID